MSSTYFLRRNCLGLLSFRKQQPFREQPQAFQPTSPLQLGLQKASIKATPDSGNQHFSCLLASACRSFCSKIPHEGFYFSTSLKTFSTYLIQVQPLAQTIFLWHLQHRTSISKITFQNFPQEKKTKTQKTTHKKQPNKTQHATGKGHCIHHMRECSRFPNSGLGHIA